MKYHKPEVLDIGVQMQRADGQVHPNACVSGPAATGNWESCGTGTGAGWSCESGSGVVVSALSCIPGVSASSGGDCLSGTSVSYVCGAGTSGYSDPEGCVSGPSYS